MAPGSVEYNETRLDCEPSGRANAHAIIGFAKPSSHNRGPFKKALRSAFFRYDQASRSSPRGGAETAGGYADVGRVQTGGVRKFVTRKCACLVYYTVDDAAEEIVILNVKHPGQCSGYEDARPGRRACSTIDQLWTRRRMKKAPAKPGP